MYIFNSVFFFAILPVTISVDPCKTINNQPGDCKPINQCPSIFVLFNGNSNQNLGKILQQSNCGLVDRIYPKVCCPINSPLPPETNDLLLKPPNCGTERDQYRIYNANKTFLGEFPWMALLLYRRNNIRCGGVLINRRYVLTAKHCLTSDLVGVRLGEWDTRTNPDVVRSPLGIDRADPVLDIPIEEKIPHEGSRIIQNDIALLRLNQDINYDDTEFIKPICLPSSDLVTKSYLGEKLTVSGWGLTEYSTLSNAKLKANVPVVGFSTCDRALVERLRGFRDPDFISGNPICAGGEKGIDACGGDSGGPLMYHSGNWYAVGILSNGPTNPCGQENKPSIYVRVGSHVDWIISKMKP